MSFLAWIDFDQTDRERTHRIMDLFAEEDARDELGVSAVRDGLSDLMFPGTSTIQTRLRYMLFVPWIYRQAHRHAGSGFARAEVARALEIRLIEALIDGGEKTGVIGSVAKGALKRFPSDVYWAGLGVLGIRRFHGSRSAFFELQNGAEENIRLWSAGLPEEQPGFLDATTFRLTRDEAGFLIDRLHQVAPYSLFRELVASGESVQCASIWTHPMQATWTKDNQTLVRHAQFLAHMVRGANLLYNLMLSELMSERAGEASAWIGRYDEYRTRLSDWQRELAQLPLQDWHLEDLWRRVDATAHRVTPLTRRFMTEWLETTSRAPSPVCDNPDARRIIERRERALKGAKSRFANAAALSRWSGSSGTQVLGFRWELVSSHLKDLANAE